MQVRRSECSFNQVLNYTPHSGTRQNDHTVVNVQRACGRRSEGGRSHAVSSATPAEEQVALVAVALPELPEFLERQIVDALGCRVQDLGCEWRNMRMTAIEHHQEVILAVSGVRP